MYHEQSRLTFCGICSTPPSAYKPKSKHWRKHLKRYGSNPRLITTKVIFQSVYLSEVRRWRDHYYALLDVKNNPKFLNSQYRKTKPKTTNKHKHRRWYNDGRDNMFITEGTQPSGYKLGRLITYKKPHSVDTKQRMAKSHERKVVSPDGKVYNSLKQAGQANRISASAIHGLINRRLSGWRYK